MTTNNSDDYELRDHYDLSQFKGKTVRGKYAHRFPKDSVAVVLEPEVAKVFPNAESVNAALRTLIDVAPSIAPPAARAK